MNFFSNIWLTICFQINVDRLVNLLSPTLKTQYKSRIAFLLQKNGNTLEEFMGTLLRLLIATSTGLMLKDDQLSAAKHLFFPFQLLPLGKFEMMQ